MMRALLAINVPDAYAYLLPMIRFSLSDPNNANVLSGGLGEFLRKELKGPICPHYFRCCGRGRRG
jgi:hypothetical protein